MKLQHLFLAAALAVTGSAFATTTKTTSINPDGSVTKTITHTTRHHHRHHRHVVLVKRQVVHPAQHATVTTTRTVVRHG